MSVWRHSLSSRYFNRINENVHLKLNILSSHNDYGFQYSVHFWRWLFWHWKWPIWKTNIRVNVPISDPSLFATPPSPANITWTGASKYVVINWVTACIKTNSDSFYHSILPWCTFICINIYWCRAYFEIYVARALMHSFHSCINAVVL